jgi:hypothetical protein
MPNKGNCKAKDCTREAFARLYCRKHYRLWKLGEMPKPRYKSCTFEKCHKRRFRGSLCDEHWNAAHGKKAAEAAPPPTAPADATPAASA